MPIRCQSVLVDWTLQSTFRPSLGFSATFFYKVIDIIFFFYVPQFLVEHKLLASLHWPKWKRVSLGLIICYVLFNIFINKKYIFLKLLIEFGADKKEKSEWITENRKEKAFLQLCFNEMKYVAAHLEKKIVNYIYWLEDFPCWVLGALRIVLNHHLMRSFRE